MRVLVVAFLLPQAVAGELGKKLARRNWFHPYLVMQVLDAVRVHSSSFSAAVRWLRLQWPTLYRGLNESTVRSWHGADRGSQSIRSARLWLLQA